jgi:hypothetical protein
VVEGEEAPAVSEGEDSMVLAAGLVVVVAQAGIFNGVEAAYVREDQ